MQPPPIFIMQLPPIFIMQALLMGYVRSAFVFACR